jgi:hypothetical protein
MRKAFFEERVPSERLDNWRLYPHPILYTNDFRTPVLFFGRADSQAARAYGGAHDAVIHGQTLVALEQVMGRSRLT